MFLWKYLQLTGSRQWDRLADEGSLSACPAAGIPVAIMVDTGVVSALEE